MPEKQEEIPSNEKATFPLRLEKELLEKSKELAKKRGMSLAALIRGFLIKETEADEKHG